MTKAEIEKICNEIRAEFDECFDGISAKFTISIDPDPDVYEDDSILWCGIELKHEHHSNWNACLSCTWSEYCGIQIEQDESGMEPISPAVIWRLMFFDAMHDLWLLMER